MMAAAARTSAAKNAKRRNSSAFGYSIGNAPDDRC